MVIVRLTYIENTKTKLIRKIWVSKYKIFTDNITYKHVYVVANHEVVPKEEETIETKDDSPQKIEDIDQKRTVKVKPFGGSLLAQT